MRFSNQGFSLCTRGQNLNLFGAGKVNEPSLSIFINRAEGLLGLVFERQMNKNRTLSIEKHQTIFFLQFSVDVKDEKPFNTPRRPDSSVGRAED
ncbi:hypothetical protein VSAK1_26950 [Vibrio mediterranei AK1]|nr:hypothetical protein VSAK1_26950 [Vibrio mediterranei AK1]